MKIEDIQMRPFTCHQSSISLAHGCERCFFLKERWGVELRGVKVKEGASLGKIYHKFQQLGPGHEQEVQAWVRKMQTDLMAQVDRGEDLDGQILRLANLLTTLYNKAEAMAKLFWECYPTPDYLKTIGTEIKHSMIIQDGALKGMVLGGTIDKLIQDTRNGDIWIRDHKSTGMKTLDVIFAGFPWSTQARIYRILAEDFYKNFASLKGFILDGILKPGIKLCGKDEKNAKLWNCDVEEAYLRRVKEWYAESGTAAIRSQAIMFNEPLVSWELMHELLTMQNLGSRPNIPEAYSRDPSRFHCFLYGSQCIYYDLCESPKSRWPELFETKYKIRELEPENEDSETDSE
uniref:Putative PD-(D/E)XK nuclease superfamily protein n=1 Tax=viral metagenome TaxID=1070528 RepID=A0A6M3J8J0_9ZZZZ